MSVPPQAPTFRALLVDDEPKVLDGLRRMLRPLRHEWTAEVAGSGAEALEVLGRLPIDVVVSDMRMPGMDGAALLDEVKRRHPEVVRIILSGQADPATISRALGSAHQYLAKPCDPEVLKGVLARVSSIRRLVSGEALRRLVSSLGSLPSPPDTCVAVIREAESPHCSVRRIAELISQDVAMAAKLLQLVNSAFFGHSRRVSDPLEAIRLLGLDRVKELIRSSAVWSPFKGGTTMFSVTAFDTHSLTTSACARDIATEEGYGDAFAADAAIAGLLHDVGQLVLATEQPGLDRTAAAQTRDEVTALAEGAETAGRRHAAIGAYLLGLWGLPDSVVEAVAYHHDPSECPNQGLRPVTVVHAADFLLQEIEALPSTASGLDIDYLARLGLMDRIPVWREICARERTASSVSSEHGS